MKRRLLVSLIPVALLASCGDKNEDETAGDAMDPASEQALNDELTTDPDLAGRNEANAALSGTGNAAIPNIDKSPRAIEAAFHSFAGLPHRSQTVAEAGGVRFVNDSKATNVDAAAKALAAFDRVRWICGGLEKEGGLEDLLPAAGSVIKAYVIGREAAQFAVKLRGIEAEVCTDMATAVARAMAEAEAGDTVLLAPAAASFDQYDNFEKRGEDFVACVEAEIGGK